MIRVEVIEQFTLKDYEKIKDTIKRKSIDVKGTLFVGDTFECDEDMVKYLTGNNEQGKTVVKVIEVEPEYEVIKVEETYRNKNKEKIILKHEYVKPKKKKSSKKGE